MAKAGTKKKAKPFLKWVGGKRQMLSQYEEHFPTNFNNYFEPFVGGGAVFFYLLPEKAYLNDVNKDLMNAFEKVRDDLGQLTTILQDLEEDYLSEDEDGRKEFYYNMRNRYNELQNGDIERTALLFFLNKTCFNGMYRVNNSGEFNVPHGRYKNPTILDKENLEAVSAILRNTQLSSVDFEKAVEDAGKEDFVYLDPPYDPLDDTSDFTEYSEDGFDVNDQKRLSYLFEELDERGCYVMLSNSATDFIKRLYRDFRIEPMKANRYINSDGSSRGEIDELLILNY
jgi:DNA adenine methylase